MWKQHQLAYCSNLHAGETLDSVQQNIARYVAKVRQKQALNTQYSGLWLSAKAAQSLTCAEQRAQFTSCLTQHGVVLTSLNGFPYGNFHDSVVKAKVYQPHWATPERLTYTQQLANILAQCLPSDVSFGAISTLPLGYKADFSVEQYQQALRQLLQLNRYLADLHERTQKRVIVCLEMEPDCALQSTDELIACFSDLTQLNGEYPAYLGACFDVCHQAVMYEDIYHSLRCIHEAGITLGKIQVSNAIHVDLSQQTSALKPILHRFAEPKFLHQVKARVHRCGEANSRSSASSHSSDFISAPDLATFLEEQDLNAEYIQDFRVHFHVPLNAEQFIHPAITPLHAPIHATLQFLSDYHTHVNPLLEVETYSWDALPDELQPTSDEQLIQGVSNEINWLAQQLKQRGLL